MDYYRVTSVEPFCVFCSKRKVCRASIRKEKRSEMKVREIAYENPWKIVVEINKNKFALFQVFAAIEDCKCRWVEWRYRYFSNRSKIWDPAWLESPNCTYWVCFPLESDRHILFNVLRRWWMDYWLLLSRNNNSLAFWRMCLSLPSYWVNCCSREIYWVIGN